MLFKSIVVGALAALAAAQSSTLTFTSVPNTVSAGQAQAIKYTSSNLNEPVTILLRKGDANDLQTVETLTSSATGGTYNWTPSSSLQNGANYALQITQGDQSNYFGPFTLTGGSAMGSSSSASMSSASMTSMSSSMMTSAPVYGSATMPSMRNSTSAGAATGTGMMSMSRNGTMSSATLSSSRGAGASSTGSGSGAGSTGAGFQGGSSTGSSPASSTGGASGLTTGSSAVALVFGAVAAVLFA